MCWHYLGVSGSGLGKMEPLVMMFGLG
jgi:hypothetical protein